MKTEYEKLISELIKELQTIENQWGDTCVYIRDLSFVALNRQAEYQKKVMGTRSDGKPCEKPWFPEPNEERKTICPKCGTKELLMKCPDCSKDWGHVTR